MKRLAFALSFAFLLAGCVGDAPVAGPDAGPDVSTPDTSTPDTSIPDTSTPDTSNPDAPPAFTPAKLSGLVLWLDAQQASTLTPSTGKITQWADRTSYQTHAVAASGSEPTLGTDAVTGKPVLLFNKSLMSIGTQFKTELEWGTTTDFTISIVASYGPPSGGILLRKMTTTGFILVNISGETRLKFGLDSSVVGNVVTDNAAYNDVKLRLYTFRRKGSGLTLEMRVNGVSTATNTLASVVDVTAGAAPILLGARDATTEQMTGAMGEIVAIKDTLSDPDLATLETYLKTKWGL